MAPEEEDRADEAVPPRTSRASVVAFAGTCLLTLTSLIGGIIAIAIFASQDISSSVGVSQTLTLIAVRIPSLAVFIYTSDDEYSHYYHFSISASISSQRDEMAVTTLQDDLSNPYKQLVL